MHINIPDNNTLKTIFACVKNAGYEIRLVGGFVRDSLLGRAISDIDMAINCTPNITTEIFEKAGYSVIPTGIAHGTVSVVLDDEVFEITSLRRDVETDGRCAVVAYTDDWKMDATRRDFTINALYADADGLVYDYVNAVSDVENKTLRFVGDGHVRVAEDSLRILRYYRFMVQLNFTPVNDDCANACTQGAILLKRLSFERVGMEMKKMFSVSSNPTTVINMMLKAGVLSAVLPFPIKVDLPFMNNPVGQSDDALLKCIALASADFKNAQTIGSVWKFSNADRRYMRSILTVYTDRAFVPALLHRFAYYHGRDIVIKASMLKVASGVSGYDNVAKVLEQWECPIFPLTGQHLMTLGVESSPALGALLKAVEMWWVVNAFNPRMQDCLIFAKQRMNIKR